MKKDDVYQQITDKMVESLEQGIIPWKRSWSSMMPKSLSTGNDYRGANILTLLMQGQAPSTWGTYKKITETGGQVRKGEKGTHVFFWFPKKKKDSQGKVIMKDGKPDTYMSWLCHPVFNVDQADWEDESKKPIDVVHNHDPIQSCVQLIDGMPNPPELYDGKPCYSLTADTVRVPTLNLFDNPELYYSVLFHELVHSTGHESRCNRDMNNVKGDHDYAFEELIAEMGAAFLCGITGITNDNTERDSTAYIQSWLKAFQGDTSYVIRAASAAQKAVDYIVNKTWEKDDE